MSEFSRRRKWIQVRDQINAPITINPFVFTKSFFIWVALGIIGGIVAAFYWVIVDFLMEITHAFTAGWQVISIMGGAGLIIGLIIHFRGDPGELQVVLNNIRFKGGRVDTKHNPSMIVTSLIGIGAGSSAGPEAPMVQVVCSIGSWMARKLKLRGEEYRSLSIAGMATGFTAMFGAPLGGSLFALEIMHHKHVVEYYAALIPAFVASGTSFIIFQFITQMGLAPVWELPFEASEAFVVTDFFWAMGYGVVAAGLGWLIIYAFRGLTITFKKAKLPFYIQTTLSGLILGFLAWKLPITRYFSHYEVIDLLAGSWTIGLLVLIMFVKIFSMALTVTSGWRGGFIIPLFFIGAALGLVVFKLFPGQNVGLAVVCCMAAVNACVTRTPISTIILVSTLTGFGFFMPILFASLTGFFLAPKSPLIAAQLGKEKAFQEE